MKKLMLLLAILAIASLALADNEIVGKKGQKLPVRDMPDQPGHPTMRADVEYNTTGVMDEPATTGGSWDGWGTYFIASWVNLTGQDVTLAEFGWPCGGAGPVDWVVWITSGGMPGAPGSQTFTGNFVPASSDDLTNPPPIYSYIDVSAANIVIPPDQVMFWGYENPGIGGQITANGTDTWAWYGDMWDPDSGWSRTAVLQFKGNYGGVPAQATSFSHVKALFD